MTRSEDEEGEGDGEEGGREEGYGVKRKADSCVVGVR